MDRRFTALFAVFLMVVTAFAVTVPEADAGDSNTVEMRAEVDERFTRSTDKIGFDKYWVDDGMYFTDSIQDELFQKYIDGKSEDFMDKVVKNPREGSRYYAYSVGASYMDVEFYRAAPTAVIMPAGETMVSIVSDVDYVDLIVGWDRVSLNKGSNTPVDVDRAQTAHLKTSVTDFDHLKPITVWFDDSSMVPKACDPEKEIEMNTNLVWYHDTVKMGQGHVWAEDLFVFTPGTAGEEKFVREVIDGGKADFKFSDYGIRETGNLAPGTYSVYKADKSYGWVTDTSYAFFSDAGGFELPIFREPADLYTVFAKPNSTMSAGMVFDESKFIGYLQVGYEMYRISSGFEYSYDVTYATEVTLYLEPLLPNHPYTSGDVKIVCHGTESESGSPTGMAAVCIILAALVFVGLFLFNRKPHW